MKPTSTRFAPALKLPLPDPLLFSLTQLSFHPQILVACAFHGLSHVGRRSNPGVVGDVGLFRGQVDARFDNAGKAAEGLFDGASRT